jgi:protein TonB
VVVQFTIEPSGSVSNCTPARPSGNAEMDALTCRIVVQRARFAPARDAQGRAVASQAHATYVWGRGRRSKN